MDHAMDVAIEEALQAVYDQKNIYNGYDPEDMIPKDIFNVLKWRWRVVPSLKAT